MNKQELIDKLKKQLTTPSVIKGSDFDFGHNYGIELAIIFARQLEEPEKPVVPQVAVEFYERYKDDNLALGEWFGDFYSPEAIEEFPRMDELTKWLHDNNNETNRQREFALATLVTLGIDAVEVEKEKLYYVNIPNVYHGDFGYSETHDNYSFYNKSDATEIRFELTESEIKLEHEWAWQFAKEVEE